MSILCTTRHISLPKTLGNKKENKFRNRRGSFFLLTILHFFIQSFLPDSVIKSSLNSSLPLFNRWIVLGTNKFLLAQMVLFRYKIYTVWYKFLSNVIYEYFLVAVNRKVTHDIICQQVCSYYWRVISLKNSILVTILFKASALWADAFYKSICPSVRLSVCPSVRLSVCSLLRYRLTVFLPPLPEVGCPISLEIWNPWGKVMERSEHKIWTFLFENCLKSPRKKKFFSSLFWSSSVFGLF